MSISAVPYGWFKAPSGAERTWLGLALLWCIVLTIAMPYWHLKGKQNSTGMAYKVAPADFGKRVEDFVSANKVDTSAEGLPIVQAPPGGDAYVYGQMWRWYPILKLKKDQTYRIHVSSLDIQHGFSILPMNMNFQIIPGYDHVLTITPTAAGSYSIICNEFCGIGHHMMTGRIIVEE